MGDGDGIRAQRVLDRLRAVAAKSSGYDPADLDENSAFIELGFDSLCLIQLATLFQSEHGIRITPRQLFDELPTLRAVADHIEGQLPAEAPVEVADAPEATEAAMAVPGGAPGDGAVMGQPVVDPDAEPAAGPVGGRAASQAGMREILAQQLALMAQQIQMLRLRQGTGPAAHALDPSDIFNGAKEAPGITPLSTAADAASGPAAARHLPDRAADTAFVQHLGKCGVELTGDQGVLLVSAPKGVVDAAMFQEIVCRKSEILGCLQAKPEADTGDGVESGGEQAITPADGDERLALSFAQQRLWFVAQMGQEASAAYHLSMGFHLCGELDHSALRQALDRLVARHEALRTTFVQVDGEPTQCIGSAATSGFHLLEQDLAGDRDPVAGLARLVAEEAQAPFDLEHGPLIRGRLIREAAEQHTLLITMHHIISDGWSLRVLMHELGELYGAYRQWEEDPLPPLALQYADYAAWQRRWVSGDILQEQADYWKTALAGAPARLELPTDQPRPAEQDHAGGFIDCRLDAGLAKDLKALSQRHGTTLFMTLLASWAALLARLSGQSEVVIGTPSANRGRSEIEGLVGFFVNTLALRVDLSGSPTVGELLARVRTQALDAQQHQDIPFEQVVELVRPERSLAHSPLFQVMFAWDSPSVGGLNLPGLTVAAAEEAPKVTSQFDLTLVLGEDAGQIVGGMEYATALFERATVERYMEHWRALLAAMVADDGVEFNRLQVPEEWIAAAAEPREQHVPEMGTSPEIQDQHTLALVHEAPQGALETTAAGIFAELLRVERVGRHDNFFELGGHSLLGARLLALVGEATGVRLPVRALFEAPSVAQLAAAVEAARNGPTTQEEVARQADQSRAPLSLMQQRLWVQEQILPGQANYNISSAYRLCGPLDVIALETALTEVVQRQATLRSELGSPDEGAIQRVHERLDVALPVEDLSALAAEEAEDEAMRRMGVLSEQPIALEQAPLFRVCLYRLAEDEHLLFFVVHHAIWDGRSQELLLTEMAALYEANTGGRAADLPPLARSYVDFVHWHLAQASRPEMKRHLAHWKEHLAGELEPLHLPEDLPRPTLPTGRGGAELVQTDGTMLARLRQIGAQADASLFMTLLAAYLVWLHRMTGQQDLVVGVPVRSHVSEEMDRVMGFFVNIVPMRARIDPALSFLQILERVRQTVLNCFTHADVPLESLVRELGVRHDSSRTPIFQSLFSFEETDGCMPRWGALSCEEVPLPQATANHDLSLWCSGGVQGLTAALNYNSDIILARSAERMARRFEALLAALPDNLEAPVGDIDFMSEGDRNALEQWNATTAPLPAHATLHAMLAEQFTATPKFDAIHFGGHILSYAQLQARSERIASVLAERGVGAGDRVGVCLGRHPDMVATMIGILVAGAAYVPLDPGYPPDRLQFMAGDAGLALVVSEGELAGPLRWPRDKLLLLDVDAAQIEATAIRTGFPSVGADGLAYIIYTSGSTGKPKGVRVPHGAVVNFLRSMRREPGITASDRLMAVTTTSFDISVLELFLPLTVGASVVLASREEAFDGDELARLLASSKATMMQATPSAWRLLLDAGWDGGENLKALCGGEPLPVDLAEQLIARGCELWNMYGPTEATVWSTCTRVSAAAPGEMMDVHIGRPIDNTTVWVLDPRGQPCPPGVSGEICIGGAGVTLGYHERPELTASRFTPDPFTRVAVFGDATLPRKMYHTGDRGRWRHDGVLRHEGRIDFQVKLRGHRIEPGEIEACLVSCIEIAQALVIVREDQPNDQRLVAYVVLKEGATLDDTALRSRLRDVLPAYMLPQHFVPIDALPLLPNGKVDRSALPTPAAARAKLPAKTDQPVAIFDPRVRYMADLWSELLGVTARPDDNFFDLGGHSMLAVQMANRVAQDKGVRIKLIRLGAETLQQIALDLPMRAADAPDAASMGKRIGQGLTRIFGERSAAAK